MREISYGFYISELKFAQRLTGQPYNVVIGWSVEIFFYRTEQKNQRSGMILEVQSQNFVASRPSKFSF